MAPLREVELLLDQERFADAVSLVDELLEGCEPHPSAAGMHAALVLKGVALVHLDRYSEANKVFSDVRSRASCAPAGEMDVVSIENRIAEAFFARGHELAGDGRHAQALTAALAVLTQFGADGPPTRPDIIPYALRLKATAQAGAGDSRGALATLTGLARGWQQFDDPRVRLAVLGGQLRRADLLATAGKRKDALLLLDDVIAEYGAASEPDIRAGVEHALRSKLAILQEMRRTDDLLAAHDELIRCFRERPPENSPYTAVDALASKASILSQLGRLSEAIAASDELVAVYGEDSDPYVRLKVAGALGAMIDVLARQKRESEIVSTATRLVDLFGEADDAELRLEVARALNNKAVALGSLDRYNEGVAAADKLIAWAADDTRPEIGEQVARIMVRKAVFLRKLDRLDEAIDTFRAVVERFGGDDPAPAVQELVARAFEERISLLQLTGRDAEAIVLSDSLIQRVSGDPTQLPRELDALNAKAAGLLGEGRFGDALVVLAEVGERFEDDPQATCRGPAAVALNNKVSALTELGRADDAQSAFQELVETFPEEALEIFRATAKRVTASPAVQDRELCASALQTQAQILHSLGRDDEALVALAAVISRFENDEDDRVRRIVAAARSERTVIVEACAEET